MKTVVKSKYISASDLQPGMKIDQNVVDRLGRDLVVRGTILNENLIKSLLKFGISHIYIQSGEYQIEEEEKIASSEALKNIERLRVADCPTVTLSHSVRERVAEGIQYIYNNTESKDLSNMTNNVVDVLTSAIRSNNAIAIDINALKTSDEYTFKHSVDVATIAMVVAKKQGMSRKQIHEIGVAGMLHDLGKTVVPSDILNKPAKLDDDEFAVMKKHALFGYEMVKDSPGFNPEVSLAILQHHEKVNGTGYPLGLRGSQVVPYAKILCVADIYDALVTARPYKEAFSQRDALEIIMSMSGELDVDVMRSFMESVILYPVDSIVELSSGEKAKVVKNGGNILRPTVVGLTTGRVYDLGDDLACASIIIK